MDACKILLYISTSSHIRIFCSTQNNNAKIVHFSPYNFYNVYEYYMTNTMCDLHKYNFKKNFWRSYLENNLVEWTDEKIWYSIVSFRTIDNKKNVPKYIGYIQYYSNTVLS